MTRIRIGTRASKLAVAQASIVSAALGDCPGRFDVEIVKILTEGDCTDRELADVGGKGLFTGAIEKALEDGRIDLAVHSAKDVPIDMSERFAIAAIPDRADPADALVTPSGCCLDDLPSGATVGTSSLRRRAQLLAMRRDLKVVPMRGNVETRLRRVLTPGGQSRLDGVVLAMAGLQRSGLSQDHADKIHRLDVEKFMPAAGQGALLVQCLAGSDAAVLAGRTDKPVARRAVIAERSVLARLSADCHSCVAVHVCPSGGCWKDIAMVARPDGREQIYARVSAKTAKETAEQIFDHLSRQGATELLRG